MNAKAAAGVPAKKEKVGLLFHFVNESNVHLEGEEGATYQNGYGSVATSDKPYLVWYNLNVYHINAFLENIDGLAEVRGNSHNQCQYLAEKSRLGIPVTFSADREYNSWAGMIDFPRSAFGAANDLELSEQIWNIYSKEMAAMKYQVTFNPSSVELGSTYGSDVEYIADMTVAEITAIQSGGLQNTAKHFVARGGDTSNVYDDSKIQEETFDTWMYPWKQVIDAGVKWIMITERTGMSGLCSSYYDTVTVEYLRNELGFDGVIVTDWGPQNATSGVLADGRVLTELSLGELFSLALNAGIDQFGGVMAEDGVPAILEAVEQGYVTESNIDEHAFRTLRAKFEAGLFENPYVDIDKVYQLIASKVRGILLLQI